MLTIFTCPKSFKGHIDIIQRNAINSWLLLEPKPEVLLIGDDEGVSQLAQELGVCHLANLEINDYGTPLVSSLFRIAEYRASNEMLSYVNADIILGQDFIDAAVCFSDLKNFLMIGHRWNVDVREAIDWSDDKWRHMASVVRAGDSMDVENAIDYFVFKRGLWPEMPKFALGRCAWDNWLIYAARKHDAKVIDATESVTAIHQNHDYQHSRDKTQEKLWKGEEAERNRELAGGNWNTLFTILDSTHVLGADGLKQARTKEYLEHRVERMQNLRPRLFKALMSWKLRYLLCWLFPSL